MTSLLRRVALWTDVVVFLGLWVFALRRGARTEVWWIGLVLAAAGLAGWLIARVQLGSAFSLGAQARCLITSGLYGYLRHPIYLFGGLAWLGALLSLQNWFVLGAWLALTVVLQSGRIRREERALAARFGESYRLYRARTWM